MSTRFVCSILGSSQVFDNYASRNIRRKSVVLDAEVRIKGGRAAGSIREIGGIGMILRIYIKQCEEKPLKHGSNKHLSPEVKETVIQSSKSLWKDISEIHSELEISGFNDLPEFIHLYLNNEDTFYSILIGFKVKKPIPIGELRFYLPLRATLPIFFISSYKTFEAVSAFDSSHVLEGPLMIFDRNDCVGFIRGEESKEDFAFPDSRAFNKKIKKKSKESIPEESTGESADVQNPTSKEGGAQ